MEDKINGRTPEEIKTGLLCSNGCCDCPYAGCITEDETCSEHVEKDVLALIDHLEAKVPRWISVEERLPEYVISAFVYARLCGGGRICKIGSTYISSFMPPTKSWSDVPDGWKVTHWMPLPEPPEVSK